MSSRPPNAPDQENTTILHLSEFVREDVLSPAQSSPQEGATAFIRRAAAETAAESPEPLRGPTQAKSLSPEELLGAVAYCYAKGICSSEEIEQRMVRDPEFRLALEGIVPDSATIRSFRRLNRRSIQVVLEKFYARLLQNQPRPAPPAVARDSGGEAQCKPNEHTETYVRRAALSRLQKAAFLDSVAED